MSTQPGGWTRRDLAGGIALFALALGIPAAAVKLTDINAEDMPSDRQRRLIGRVADLVIPRTDTPGAADVGVGDFMILALAHGLSGTRDPMTPDTVTSALEPFRRLDGSLRHLPWLESTLDHAAGGDFMRQDRTEQARLLSALDAQAMARGAPWSPWVAIKGLILTGYYTTEAGGSKELRYNLVPGRFDPDLPLKPDDRAFSSDWTALDFG